MFRSLASSARLGARYAGAGSSRVGASAGANAGASASASAYDAGSILGSRLPLAGKFVPLRQFHATRSSGKWHTPFFKSVSWAKQAVGWTFVILAIPAGYTLAFFIYDSTTYRDGPLEMDVRVPPAALDLKRGGPKNLPIAEAFIDDEQLGQNFDRPRLVILGSGWGAVSMIQGLDVDNYNITMVSPTNHFLFTPLLPSAAVGTVSLGTLVEPIRHICRNQHARFIEAAAHDIEFNEKLVEVRSLDADGKEAHFYVPYDKLIIATGASTNTHGVPGLEYCHMFKSASDCQKLRAAICRNLEIAALPSTNEDDRRRLLSFVICGGGPTGVELAAEIYDLLKEDMPKFFPHLLVNHASVHVIQSRSAILNTYDESISEYAMNRFMKDGIDLQTNSRVQEVKEDSVVFSKVNSDTKEKETYELPSGLTLWTTGVSLTRFVKKVMEKLPGEQKNRRALETDSHLRLIGVPKGEVYAIGDASTVRTALAEELETSIRSHMSKENLDTRTIDRDTMDRVLTAVARREPQARQHVIKLRDKLWKWYDPGEKLSIDQIAHELQRVDSKVTSLPATAQRASQQGIYLAHKLNRLAVVNPQTIATASNVDPDDIDGSFYRPFSYHHLGSLAYVSNAAVFDTNGVVGFNVFGGLMAMYLWRGVYMSQTVSSRARVHMFFDWLYRGLFGRQIYAYDRIN